MSSKILLAAVLPAPERPVMIATCCPLLAPVTGSAAGPSVVEELSGGSSPMGSGPPRSANSGTVSGSAIPGPAIAGGFALDALRLAALEQEDGDLVQDVHRAR